METIAFSSEQQTTSSVIEQLHPVPFIDEDGAQREVFQFADKGGNQVGVIFYTREELPFSKGILQGREGFILGQAPKHRDSKEWQGFIEDVRSASGYTANPLDLSSIRIKDAISGNKAVLFVENTPVNILDLAFLLGLEGKEWREDRQKAALKGVYSKSVLNIVDDMIAGTTVGEDGSVAGRQNQRGEALAAMALLVNGQARMLLDKKKKVLEKKDEESIRQQKEFSEKTYGSLTKEGASLPEKVFATHVTKYKPEITDEGILLRSSFDATGGEMTRNTVHFSLRGPITGHYGISGIENMPYVITGDLAKMREANGNPLMVNEIDTYFALNPGQPLVIPDGQLEMPGRLPNGIIRESRGPVTIYKQDALTSEDIDTLFRTYYDHSLSRLAKEDIDFFFKQQLSSWLLGDNPGGVPDEVLDQRIKKNEFARSADCESIFAELRTKGIEAAAESILHGVDIPFDVNDKNRLKSGIENWLKSKIRNGTFYESVFGSDSQSEKDIMLLAASWGTKGSERSQAHSEDTDGGFGLQFAAGKVFSAVSEYKRQLEEWKKEKLKDRFSLMPQLKLNGEVIDINDRQGIMRSFRNSRLSIFVREKVKRPENRRMYFLAGLI